jgi:hypothetical protein
MSDLGKLGAAGLKKNLDSQGVDVLEHYQKIGTLGGKLRMVALKKRLESQGTTTHERH